MEKLPAVQSQAGRRKAQHVKLPFAAEMILDAETGQLIGMMLTSENPEAAQALDRLMNGEYAGMEYCKPVTFRPAQYNGTDDKGQVWLQQEATPEARHTELIVHRERHTVERNQVFNPNGFFMDR